MLHWLCATSLTAQLSIRLLYHMMWIADMLNTHPSVLRSGMCLKCSQPGTWPIALTSSHWMPVWCSASAAGMKKLDAVREKAGPLRSNQGPYKQMLAPPSTSGYKRGKIWVKASRHRTVNALKRIEPHFRFHFKTFKIVVLRGALKNMTQAPLALDEICQGPKAKCKLAEEDN